MRWKHLILLFPGLLFLLVINAQVPGKGRPLSNIRSKYISARSDTLQLDSLSLVPGSFRMSALPDSLFTVDYLNATLVWTKRPALDSVKVTYRVYPTRINAVVKRMNYDSVMNNFLGKPFIPDFGEDREANNFFQFGNINYNGSFGRGISFGNTQDAVVTSNLNLQLNGYLADSIEILAAITDNNIPIQPDGTTQELNEFDRIFLQFKKKNWALSLGDIDLREQNSYFLSFYKRLQGVAFETTTDLSPHSSNKTTVSGSIAKGKFTRNVFQGQEGNQGPYRLQGANNEFFFVVLANTERVYIDGELMQRGEDQDYVINYNTAEITFTPRRMITKDKRIQVEFEYADRNYLNANIYLANETNINDKVKVQLGFFNNSDAKTSPINQTLNTDQKEFLNRLGDSVNQAFYPNAVVDTFSAGKILYKKLDTLYNGGQDHDTIYVYSTNPDSARYSLSFIDVGQGHGNYVPDFNGANGKVYKWVEPVNGVKQGNFEPAIFLVTPKKQQLFSLGIDYAMSKNSSLRTEAAMSNYDINTFSSIDKGNDKGYAFKTLFKNQLPLGNAEKGNKLISNLGYEWVGASFKPLERLRNVEFTRDWGLPLQVSAATESILNGGLELANDKGKSIRYQLTNYHRSDGFNGWRNTVAQQQTAGSWQFNNVLMLSKVGDSASSGFFFRPVLDVSKRWKKWRNYITSVNYTLEHNEIRNRSSDSVNLQSFKFSTIQMALRSNPDKANKWSLTWFNRTDAYPIGKSLVKADRSSNVNLQVELLKSERHQFRFNTTYRRLHVITDSISGLKSDNSLLGRAEYLINEWKGLLTGNILYETGAGQEQKRDVTYVEVPAGQGEYTWNDYNNDGVQQLNEFEVALFRDQANYIRIFTPTNEFIKANYNTFNYSFNINPRAAIDLASAGGFQKFLARLNWQSSLQINKKEISDGHLQLNPFKTSIGDTSLIALTSILVNTFSFNRFSPRWGFDVSNTRNGNKALLTYGYESRDVRDWTVKSRLNISKSFLLELSGRSGTNSLASSNIKFDNRNYHIKQHSLEPQLSFTRKTNFRIMMGYKLTSRKNTQGAMEVSQINSLNSEIKYNILQSTSLLGRFTYSNISFHSMDAVPNANSPAAYIILDGLLPGKNFLWNLNLTKRLSNNLEINIEYEGRKPGSGRVVHIGRASVRALL